MTPRPRVQPATAASGPQIGSYESDGRLVVFARGEIEGASAPRFRDELVAAIDRKAARLVIDLTGATFVHSTGLDVLMGALRAADIIGGEVRLVGVGRRLRELLVQTGLHPVFVDEAGNGAGSAAGDEPVTDHSVGEALGQRVDGAGAPDTATEAALRAEIDRLRRTMQRQAVIEQAKGVLMLRYAVDDVQAFALLREWSQRSNTSVHTVADTLVNAICRGARSFDYKTELVRWLELQLRHGPDGRAGSRSGDGSDRVDGAGLKS